MSILTKLHYFDESRSSTATTRYGADYRVHQMVRLSSPPSQAGFSQVLFRGRRRTHADHVLLVPHMSYICHVCESRRLPSVSCKNSAAATRAPFLTCHSSLTRITLVTCGTQGVSQVWGVRTVPHPSEPRVQSSDLMCQGKYSSRWKVARRLTIMQVFIL